jgi:hypothetical protein
MTTMPPVQGLPRYLVVEDLSKRFAAHGRFDAKTMAWRTPSKCMTIRPEHPYDEEERQ